MPVAGQHVACPSLNRCSCPLQPIVWGGREKTCSDCTHCKVRRTVFGWTGRAGHAIGRWDWWIYNGVRSWLVRYALLCNVYSFMCTVCVHSSCTVHQHLYVDWPGFSPSSWSYGTGLLLTENACDGCLDGQGSRLLLMRHWIKMRGGVPVLQVTVTNLQRQLLQKTNQTQTCRERAQTYQHMKNSDN